MQSYFQDELSLNQFVADHFEIQGKSYYLERNSMSYLEAVSNCNDKFGDNVKGRLFEPRDANVTTQVVNHCLLKLKNDQELNPHVWLGINDKTSKGVFTYETGGYLLMKNWNMDKSTVDTNGRACVQAIHNLKGQWNIMPCAGYNATSICEVHVEKGISNT